MGGKNHVEPATNVRADAYNMRREGMGFDNQNAAKSLKAMLKSGQGSCHRDTCFAHRISTCFRVYMIHDYCLFCPPHLDFADLFIDLGSAPAASGSSGGGGGGGDDRRGTKRRSEGQDDDDDEPPDEVIA